MSKTPSWDREAVIRKLRETAARLGHAPTRDQFCRLTGLSRRALGRYGHFETLKEASGLESRRTERVDDTKLLTALRDGLTAAGGVVARARLGAAGYSRNTIIRRWSGWDNALAALRDWLQTHEPEFPHLDALRRHCAAREAATVRPSTPPCGELLRFRSLDHAPLTEAAVVFLFGLVSEELGFVIETVGTGFPDATGRRRAGGVWRRVRLEFEYQSRNFKNHGHDPRGCDLVVCWEHNWPDCPMEVLELKREIARLAP